MISNVKRKSDDDKALSDLEEIELVQNLSLMKTTLDLFPEAAVARQSKVHEWAKLEQWAMLATKALYGLLKQLAPLQTRSEETERAFGATLEAYDVVSDITKQRFANPNPLDFTTARQALERCFSTAHRLI